MKNKMMWAAIALTMMATTVVTGCSDDDEDKVTIERLTGSWKLVKSTVKTVYEGDKVETEGLDQIVEIFPNGYFVSTSNGGTTADKLFDEGNNEFHTVAVVHYKLQLSDNWRTLTVSQYLTESKEVGRIKVFQRQATDDIINPQMIGKWQLTQTAFGNKSRADTTVVSVDETLEILRDGDYRKTTDGKTEVAKCRTKGNMICISDSIFYNYLLVDNSRTLVLREFNPENNGIHTIVPLEFKSWIYQRMD
ncbi:MAG: hypothetical protein K6G08_10800 [Prevotella sp.]|nr:hypothetical protein [Prevotella sp.]